MTRFNLLQSQQPICDPNVTPAWLMEGLMECGAQDQETREAERAGQVGAQALAQLGGGHAVSR